jgi:hypothetical protein
MVGHFLWAFVGIGLMVCAWSLATPLTAAPDESAHTIQAVAVVRGELDEPVSARLLGTSLAWVRVPCWVDTGFLPPQCHRATTGLAPTQYSNAPPLYYIVVGAPSLFLSGNFALYVMRITGAVLNSGVCALGICLLLRYFPRRTMLLGVMLAVSPMFLFLMAVINSSGFEIAAAFATWCGGLCVITHRTVPRALAAWTALAAVLLILSRPTSPLDALVIACVLGVFVGWRGLRARLNASLHPVWIPVGAAMAVAVVFFLVGGAPYLIRVGALPHPPASLFSNILTTLRLTGGYLEQSVGNFGYLLIPVPTWIVVVWAAFVIALTTAAIVVSASCRRALPVLAVAVVAVTIGLQAPQINHVGTYFQGRYILPLLVGFPLVASAFEWRTRTVFSRRMLTRIVVVVGIVLAAAQLTSFVRAMQYYSNGQGIHIGVQRGWLPPGGEVGVTVMFLFGVVITLALFVFAASFVPSPKRLAKDSEGTVSDSGARTDVASST